MRLHRSLLLTGSLLGMSGMIHRVVAQQPIVQLAHQQAGCPRAKNAQVQAHMQTLLDTLLTPPPNIDYWRAARIALGSPALSDVHILRDSADAQLCTRITARLDSAGQSAYSATNHKHVNVLYYRIGRSDTTFVISEPILRPKPKRRLQETGPNPVVVFLDREIKIFRM